MPRSILKTIEQVPDVVAETDLVHKATGKPLKVPKRVRQAILNILSGAAKNAAIAADQVGLSPEHLYRMMKKAHVQVFMASERRRTIADASLKAAGRLSELIHASSEHVSLDASKHVLAIEGISPKQQGVSVDVNIRAGYVIRLGSSNAPGAGQRDQQVDVVDTVAVDITGK